MNDAKSVPFAHIPYVKNPCIPPKISKSHNFGKLSEIRRPFSRFARRKLELAKFTANCAKFAQFAHSSYKSREIRAIRANFTHYCAPY